MVLSSVSNAISDEATRMRKLRGYSQTRPLIKALDAERRLTDTAANFKATQHVPSRAVTDHG